MTSREPTEEEIKEMKMKEFRKQFPSGWMELSRYETLVLVIDVLLESSPNREFTGAELADKAGSTPRSVQEHIDSLVRLGVAKRLEDRSEPRYQLNPRSPIVRKLFEINTTVEKVKNEELEKSITRERKKPDVEQNTNTSDNNPTQNTTRKQPQRVVQGAD